MDVLRIFPNIGGDSVSLVIASPAQPGVAIQSDGLLRRPFLWAPRNDKLSQYKNFPAVDRFWPRATVME